MPIKFSSSQFYLSISNVPPCDALRQGCLRRSQPHRKMAVVEIADFASDDDDDCEEEEAEDEENFVITCFGC
ncbi:hypothetical protein PoB_004988700 [Plakobranchus ocellatus]|uniref:Uncharacterized protein n=1 Tax=Plakobranchus ocellatus TaxID=259542 RepID=A0AAV4BVM5_9GAST|nr:hypothetical protein PoB_004988700 [Plakobranchus ocellatus]